MSLVVLIRQARPFVTTIIIMAWIGYRLLRLVTTDTNTWIQDPTTMELLQDGIAQYQMFLFNLWLTTSEGIVNILSSIVDNVIGTGVDFNTSLQDDDAMMMTPMASMAASSSSSSVRMMMMIDFHSLEQNFIIPAISLLCKLIQDIMGLYAIGGFLRFLYLSYHVSWNEWKLWLEDVVFQWAKDHLSIVNHYMDKETDKMTPDMKKALGKDKFQNNQLLVLPKQGRNCKKILQELKSYSTEEHKKWQTGKTSGTIYCGEESHLKFMNSTYSLYCVANTLHPGMWPKLNQCETELIAMTSNLLHGTGIGATSSGGTESIMLAIRAHLVYYGKKRGIIHPELICGSTAHAAVDKACETYGIRKVCIDCDDSDGAGLHVLNPAIVRRYVTSNTILIYASAPNYPQGTIDPVEELGEIAEDFDIGLHVDACLGGFVLPFAPKEWKLPKFDFQVPGVTSISTDTHKFGYAPKGTSIVLYRTKALRHAQYFCYSQWSGGIYATPTFAGSRPSSLIGCAWASLVSIGYDGYMERTKQILSASALIVNGIQKYIPELYVMGNNDNDPTSNRPTMVICLASRSQMNHENNIKKKNSGNDNDNDDNDDDDNTISSSSSTSSTSTSTCGSNHHYNNKKGTNTSNDAYNNNNKISINGNGHYQNGRRGSSSSTKRNNNRRKRQQKQKQHRQKQLQEQQQHHEMTKADTIMNNNNNNNNDDDSFINIYRVADAMKDRGWHLNSLQHPPSVHICVTLAVAPNAQIFLNDLKDCVTQIKKEDPELSKKGTSSIYGMAGSIPEGPINDLMRTFIDLYITA